MSLVLELAGASETEALGGALAATRPSPAVVYLDGDLGTGKSTLARACLRGLGVVGAIRSPTYTLVERYPLSDGEAVHLDLYRIAAAAELDFLGLDDLSGQASLWLVEWPGRGGAALPPADLTIRLAVSGTGRRAELLPGTDAGRLWLERAAPMLAFRASS